MVSQKILRMGTQETPLQKTYEINAGQDSLDIDFLGANRQFDWLEISPVYKKSTSTLPYMIVTMSKGLLKK